MLPTQFWMSVVVAGVTSKTIGFSLQYSGFILLHVCQERNSPMLLTELWFAIGSWSILLGSCALRGRLRVLLGLWLARVKDRVGSRMAAEPCFRLCNGQLARDEFWATASGTGTQERARWAQQRHKISTSTSLDQPNATLCFLFCERCPDLGDRTTPITCQRKTILFIGWDRSHARATHCSSLQFPPADRKCACSPLKRDIFL